MGGRIGQGVNLRVRNQPPGRKTSGKDSRSPLHCSLGDTYGPAAGLGLTTAQTGGTLCHSHPADTPASCRRSLLSLPGAAAIEKHLGSISHILENNLVTVFQWNWFPW